MTNTDTCDDLTHVACLPVTALCAIEVGDGTLLLSGAGSVLSIWSSIGQSTPVTITTSQIFPAQAIHGITTHEKRVDISACQILVLVWGGRRISFCKIHIRLDDESKSPTRTTITQIWSQPLDDWILDVVFVGPQNGAMVLTAHNVLYQIPLHGDGTPVPMLLCDGLQTLLYSGNIACLHQSVLIASGTVFGEIIVWTCSEREDKHGWEGRLQQLYVGHQGSIFGVSISKPIKWDGVERRLLASCSDDRTIRVWDLSQAQTSDTIQYFGQEQHSTGFGGVQGSTNALAMAWGHLSRIWQTQLLGGLSSEGDDLALMSRGEDGVCQYWSIRKSELFSQERKQPVTLRPIYHDRHHAGKNIWSWAQCMTGDHLRVITGGADGQIIATSFDWSTVNTINNERKITFRNLFASMVEEILHHTPRIHNEVGKALKQCLILEDGGVVATTDSGALLRGSLRNVTLWSRIDADLSASVKALCSNLAGQLIFFATSESKIAAYNVKSCKVLQLEIDLPGQISWLQVAGEKTSESNYHSEYQLVLVFHNPQPPRLLNIRYGNEQLSATDRLLQTPPDFLITSSFYDQQNEYLVLGSRSGALAVVYGFSDSLMESSKASCVRHIHGTDSVTSIIALPQRDRSVSSDAWYLTTGKDGTYSAHVVLSPGLNQPLHIQTVHRSRPQVGPSIEGAYLRDYNREKQALVLYGFRSTNFVVWDESNQKQLLAIECGGAHRTWHFRATNPHIGTTSFVWTKAGTFNAYQKFGGGCDIVQMGGHGREIKTVAISSLHPFQHGTIIATGAEDTNIRLFSYGNEKSQFECIRVLQGHTTGLQHLKFSHCGRYLFSSAGCEEAYLWQLYEMPILGIGAILLAKLPKEAEDSDARIMNFDVIDTAKDGDHPTTFHIYFAYSNGKIKSFLFSTTTSEFEFEEECFINMTCLTQAHQLNEQYIGIGATDGVVRIVKHPNMTTIASTKIHQNNIASMTTMQLDQTHNFMITGGDDGAVGFSVVRMESQPLLQTSLVVDAHAAATTGVAIVAFFKRGTNFIVHVASAGNDQKVRTWEISLKLKDETRSQEAQGRADKSNICTMEVKRVMDLWTDVADVSSMEVIKTNPKETSRDQEQLYHQFLVVGVGMQVLRVRVDNYER